MSADLSSYLSKGFSALQVLQMIDRTFPNIARGAKSALKLGKSAEEIVGLLSKLKLKELSKLDKNAENLQFDNPLEKANQGARSQEKNPLFQGAKDLAKLGAVAAGGLGVGKLIQGLNPKQFPVESATNAFQSTLQPSTAQPQERGLPSVGQTIPASALSQLSNTGPQSQSNIAPQQAAQPTQSTNQPQAFSNPQQSASLIEQLGIGPQIQTMQQAGNSPEAIAAAVGVTMKPHQRKWLDEQIKAGKAKSLPDLITDYTSQSQANNNPSVSGTPATNEKISPEIAENVQKQPQIEEKTKLKPQKGELVATPDGEVGEIKSQRNGKALVDLNGKLHQEEEKSLEMPNEELIKAVENLLNLPEIEKSAIISSLVYRPSKKEMFVKFHNGTRYVYEDVNEEDIRPIAESMGVPVTTGKNIYGAWEKGKQDSRGAALIHGIIRNPKYAKEQEGKTWEKLETKYDRHQKLHKQSKRKRQE